MHSSVFKENAIHVLISNRVKYQIKNVWIMVCLVTAMPISVGFSVAQVSSELELSQNCIQTLKKKNNWYPVIGRNGWMFKHPLDFLVLDTELAQSENFTKLLQSLKKHQIELSIVVLPLRASVSSTYFSEADIFQHYKIEVAQENYNKAIEELKHLGVYAPNILEIAINLSKSSENPFFLSQENHWSNLGAQLVAQRLAAIVTPSLIGNETMEIVELGLSTMTGNFAEQLLRHCPEYKTIFDVEIFEISQITSQNTSMGLFDEATPSTTVLLGTSQSAMSEWGFQSHLENQLSQPIHNAAVKAGGGWRAITTYMSSPDFHTNKPKHIIWELPYNWLAELPKETNINEVNYRQIFGVLNGECLLDTKDEIINNVQELSIPIQTTQDKNLYLKVHIDDFTTEHFKLEAKRANDVYEANIVRDGFTEKHGYFYYELPKLDKLTSLQLSFAQEVKELHVRLCYM